MEEKWEEIPVEIRSRRRDRREREPWIRRNAVQVLVLCVSSLLCLFKDVGQVQKNWTMSGICYVTRLVQFLLGSLLRRRKDSKGAPEYTVLSSTTADVLLINRSLNFS